MKKEFFTLKYLDLKKRISSLFFSAKKKTSSLFFSAKKKISSLFFSAKKKKFSPSKKSFFFFFIISGFLGFFAYFGIHYQKNKKEIRQIQEAITYLKAEKSKVNEARKKVILTYPKIEKNIESILSKIKIQESSLKEIDSQKNEKKLLLELKNIDNSQLAKIIFELENSTPVIIIEKMNVQSNSNKKLTVVLEFLSLI